jgi:hypothetical protein
MALSGTKLQIPSPFYSQAPVGNAADFSNGVLIPKECIQQHVTGYVTFVKGSLTSVTLTPQLSTDGADWYDVTSPPPVTMSASGKTSLQIGAVGARVARVKVTSVGTTTGSSVVIDFGTQNVMFT